MDPTFVRDHNSRVSNSPEQPRRAFLKSLPLYVGLLSRNPAAALPLIEVSQRSDGFLLNTPSYSVRYSTATAIPSLDIFQEGQRIFHLPAVCGLSALDSDERLSSISPGSLEKPDADRYSLEVMAQSSIWEDRRFRWTFFPDHIEFSHQAKGGSRLGRCYFLSNGVSAPWTNGSSPGVVANTSIFAEEYFSPAVNLADQHYFTIAQPQSVGIAPADPAPSGYHPVNWTGDFAPPPLFLSFHKGNAWTSIGLGTQPGSYLFNSFEYTGSRYAGASFFADYLGYKTAADGFSSPVLALHFGYDEYSNLKEFVDWLDTNNFSTRRKSPDVPWHHRPIFCGWGEQENQTRLHAGVPHDFCTQANYERWIAALTSRGLPIGTIVIDDKWQRHYGLFDVDENKWPDLKSFVARQHAAGRRVLLWVPAYHAEGLEKSMCVLQKDRAIGADVTNPRYQQMLRSRIEYLVRVLDIDGFKEDWVGGVTTKPGAQLHEPVIGIEFERRFQAILYDEAHRWKPDAMIETQTPNPLFRESSDVLRLNDIWYGARNVTDIMRRRARIAHLAGWPLVDCDDASSTDLEEWWNYMQAQPQIGIPSLYVVDRMKTTLEEIPDADWVFLAALWQQYLRTLG